VTRPAEVDVAVVVGSRSTAVGVSNRRDRHAATRQYTTASQAAAVAGGHGDGDGDKDEE